MKNQIASFALFAAIACSSTACKSSKDAALSLPVVTQVSGEWKKCGSDPDKYTTGASDMIYKDDRAQTMKSVVAVHNGFGCMKRDLDPQPYLGKKIKLSGYIRSKDVNGWAGLWLRVDGPEENGKRTVLSFDNMNNRTITGTKGWTRCDLVLQVPPKATNIAFGALLDEEGQIWFANVKLEEAASTEATTDLYWRNFNAWKKDLSK